MAARPDMLQQMAPMPQSVLEESPPSSKDGAVAKSTTDAGPFRFPSCANIDRD